MATKPDTMITYNQGLPSIKSHYPLIMWSSDFDFFVQFVSLERKCLVRHQLNISKFVV